MKGKSLVGIGLVLALVLAGVATWTWAQSDDVLYYACVNNSSGTIHMVAPEDSCNNNEQLGLQPPGPGSLRSRQTSYTETRDLLSRMTKAECAQKTSLANRRESGRGTGIDALCVYLCW